MKIFDYSFLRKDTISSNLLNLTNFIHEMKNEALSKRTLNPDLFTKLVKIAIVQSVKGSNAIEGIVTSDKRINEIVNEKTEPLNHDEQEIAGYRDALNLIHDDYARLAFSEKDILDLHNVLLSPSGSSWRGRYKDRDNVILEIDNSGRRQVRFKPLNAEATPEAMRQMIYAYMDARNNANINPLLLIPCVILDFLCIHPFNDGNGRMARLLSLLLLYQNGYDVGKYVSFEQQINEHKDAYYEALKLSSKDWEIGNNDYLYFINNFIQTLYDCYTALEIRMATIEVRKIKKEERIKRVVLASIVPLSKQEIWKIIPDISVSTIERVLSGMVKERLIVKYGSFKNAKYKRK